MGKRNENTTKMKKPSDQTSTTLHPPYHQMISEAITTMKNKSGSSQGAISKFMVEKYGSTLPSTLGRILRVQLRLLVDEGRVIKVKNSYKINTATQNSTSTSTSTTCGRKMVKNKRVGKTKRLSQVKTPEGMKKTKTV